jgi:hypothetical protein
VSDIFEEVEERLRSDRYILLAQKVWPWVAGGLAAALLGALGYWGYDTWRTKEAAKSSEAYAAAVETLQKGDAASAFIQFGKAAEGATPGYKALALMQEGGIRLNQGKTDEAVKLFDQAASASPNQIIGDIARLKSALALMDTAPYAALQERLQPLIDAKRPFYVPAREALAMAKLKSGQFKAARADFVVLTLLPGASDTTRQRANLAISAIDSGAASSIPPTVKDALKLPAMPPPAPPNPDQAVPQSGADQ